MRRTVTGHETGSALGPEDVVPHRHPPHRVSGARGDGRLGQVGHGDGERGREQGPGCSLRFDRGSQGVSSEGQSADQGDHHEAPAGQPDTPGDQQVPRHQHRSEGWKPPADQDEQEHVSQGDSDQVNGLGDPRGVQHLEREHLEVEADEGELAERHDQHRSDQAAVDQIGGDPQQATGLRRRIAEELCVRGSFGSERRVRSHFAAPAASARGAPSWNCRAHFRNLWIGPSPGTSTGRVR